MKIKYVIQIFILNFQFEDIAFKNPDASYFESYRLVIFSKLLFKYLLLQINCAIRS